MAMQIFFGGPISFAFASVLNYKLPTTEVVRTVVLEGKRLGGQELYDLGIVDLLAENGAGVLKAARDLATQRMDLANGGVWGLSKVCFCSQLLGRWAILTG